jgi:hypothetical protein
VAVVGLGYVGLLLAVPFAESGFPVAGIDVDGRRVAALQAGCLYVQDIPSERVAALIDPAQPTDCSPKPATLHATDFSMLAGCDVAIIAVPTPLNKTRDPDVRYLIAVGEAVAQNVHQGVLVLLESTAYPGTTDELLLPILEKREGHRAPGPSAVERRGTGEARSGAKPRSARSRRNTRTTCCAPSCPRLASFFALQIVAYISRKILNTPCQPAVDGIRVDHAYLFGTKLEHL